MIMVFDCLKQKLLKNQFSTPQLFMSVEVDAHWTEHWLDQKCTFVNAIFLMKRIRKIGTPETAVIRGYFVHTSTK